MQFVISHFVIAICNILSHFVINHLIHCTRVVGTSVIRIVNYSYEWVGTLYVVTSVNVVNFKRFICCNSIVSVDNILHKRVVWQQMLWYTSSKKIKQFILLYTLHWKLQCNKFWYYVQPLNIHYTTVEQNIEWHGNLGISCTMYYVT